MSPTYRGVSIRSFTFAWGGFASLLAVSCETFAPPPDSGIRDDFEPTPAFSSAQVASVSTSRIPLPATGVVRFCGDGVLDVGEACDDANGVSGDGCTPSCTVEPDFECVPLGFGGCIYTGVCGDGVLASREACDQGLGVSADGCDDLCQALPGWDCSDTTAPCKPRCGDGVLTGGEACDDFNMISGDGCSNHCTRELGFECDSLGAACRPTQCGDGAIEGGEVCDDANDASGDGCSAVCQREPDCSLGPDACVSPCGDGLMLPGAGEACDDGNARAGDGCSPTCTLEAGFECWPPSPAGTETPSDAGTSQTVNDATVSPIDAGGASDAGTQPFMDGASHEASVPSDAAPAVLLDGAALNLTLGADASEPVSLLGAVGPSVCLRQAP